MLVGICAALLLIAAPRGHAQPVAIEGERGTFSSTFAGKALLNAESERGKFSSNVAGKAVQGTDFDRYFRPSDFESGSTLNGILDSLGMRGSFDFGARNPGSLEGLAAEHLDSIEEERKANAESSKAEASGKGSSGPESGGILSKLLALLGLQPADDHAAMGSSKRSSAAPQPGPAFWEEDPSAARMTELEFYAIIFFVALGVLVSLAGRSRR